MKRYNRKKKLCPTCGRVRTVRTFTAAYRRLLEAEYAKVMARLAVEEKPLTTDP